MRCALRRLCATGTLGAEPGRQAEEDLRANTTSEEEAIEHGAEKIEQFLNTDSDAEVVAITFRFTEAGEFTDTDRISEAQTISQPNPIAHRQPYAFGNADS